MELMKKILVVDDDPMNRMVIEQLLEDEPYQLAMAASGEEAIAIASQFRPDVILLDIMMPGIDGYDTCRKLREDERFQNTKIMFVSAKDLMSDQLQAIESGGDDYLAKPFVNDELLARVALLSQLSSHELAD